MKPGHWLILAAFLLAVVVPALITLVRTKRRDDEEAAARGCQCANCKAMRERWRDRPALSQRVGE